MSDIDQTVYEWIEKHYGEELKHSSHREEVTELVKQARNEAAAELAALRARVAELEAELHFFRTAFPTAARNYADVAARAALGGG